MNPVLTRLVGALAVGMAGQPAMAEPAQKPAVQSLPRVPVDHNSPELRVDRSPRNVFYQRLLVENFHRNTPGAIRAYEAHLAVADCVVDLSGERTGRLLGGAGTEDPRYRRLNGAMFRQYNTCSSINYLARLSPSVLNAAIAERLVLREVPSTSGEAPGAATTADLQEPEAARFQALARCIVAQAPAQARAVLQTPVGTDAERAALGALYASPSSCEVGTAPADTPLLVQRARLAEGLYAAMHQPVEPQR